MNARTLASRTLGAWPIGLIRVWVCRGPARGASWTLAPFSSYWRRGGESEVNAGLGMLAKYSGAVCWDFGAHFGIHSVGMAMRVGAFGQVAAFEPDPGAFRRLAHHVKINGLKNIRVFEAAVSCTAGTDSLIISHGLGSSQSHFRYLNEREDGRTRKIDVRVVVPDEMVASGEIRVPSLIKVDVQGAGGKALRGSVNSIIEGRPIIIFSNHSKEELEETRDLLEPIGYKVRSPAGLVVDWNWLDDHETAILVYSAKS